MIGFAFSVSSIAQDFIEELSLDPLYSITKLSVLSPGGKNLRVGYPLTPNLYDN